MSATILEAFLVTVGLDTKQLDQNMAQAENTIKSFGKSLATTLAPYIGAIGIGAMVNQYVDAAAELGKFSKLVGDSVENVSAWGAAVEYSGGSAADFQGSLKNLSQQIQEIRMFGRSSMSPYMMRLGINPFKQNVTEVFTDIARRFQGMSKQMSLNLGQKLGLDEGTILLLQSGEKNVKALVDSMKEQGEYLEEDTEKALEFKQASFLLGREFRAVSAIIMRGITPALSAILKGIRAFVQFLRQHKTFTITVFTLIATAITVQLMPAVIALGIAFKRAFFPITLIGGAIMLVAAIVDDFITYLHGGDSALEGFWSKFGTGEEILEKLTNIFNNLKNFVRELVRWLGAFFSIFSNIISGIYKLFSGDFTGAFNDAKNALSSMKEAFWDLPKEWIMGENPEHQEQATTALASTLPISAGVKAISSTTDTKVNVASLNIYTDEASAMGIAGGVRNSLQNELQKVVVFNAATGVNQK